MMKFDGLPREKQEKALSDIFCISCQKSFSLLGGEFATREFRGTLFVEGKCPECGTAAAKPVSTTAGDVAGK
jgi:hypothetical protein